MTDVIETLKKLPIRCYVGLETAKTLGIETGFCIKRGVAGYFPIQGKLTDERAKRMNDELGVTAAQIEAMQTGSMFGWEVPGANPDSYINQTMAKKEAGR